MRTTHALGIAAAAAGACGLVLNRLTRTAQALDFYGKSVLIFGGSRGLGLEIARQLAGEGAYVTLAARDAEELERARIDLDDRGFSATTIPCDIRDRRDVEAAIQRVITEHGAIDVLINDAGIIQVGPVELMTVADFENAMATHFWGPLYAILAALPHMRHAGERRIVNISSIGGKIAVPHLVPYSASKFALTGLSEGLRAELARDGFSVTTVCPGLMRTGSTYNAQFKGQHRQEFAWFHVSDSMPLLSTSAQRAASQIIEACRHGDPELIITPAARLAVAMNGVSPSFTQRMLAIAGWLMPSAGDADSDDTRSGWQSVSRHVPSAITTLADRATAENNELPSRRP
jgi:NAD(P)-dependent dehydrogenase (short-subunit alcohol dehydrogenase family)